MKKLSAALLILFASVSAALAQAPSMTVGGMTREACATLTVTASSAYTAGNAVGGLITLNPAYRSTQVQGAPDNGGIVQSIRITFGSAQTATFKAYQFSSNPSASTFTDKTAPTVNAADVTKVRPPITFSTADSGLTTGTVYGSDQLARASVGASQSDYWLLVTTGTPTFATTTDGQFCVTYLLD